jgi:hypothetical protein
MTEKDLQEFIGRARAQLPLPSEHAHDLIWIPVPNKSRRPKTLDEVFNMALKPVWPGHHKVYFKKNMVDGIAIGWEFYQFIEFQS